MALTEVTWLLLPCCLGGAVAAFLRVEKWEGVVWQQERVTELRLHGRGLTGSLSGMAPILEQLPGLLVLALGSNSIRGSLAAMPSPTLRTLDLGYNQLTGWHCLPQHGATAEMQDPLWFHGWCRCYPCTQSLSFTTLQDSRAVLHVAPPQAGL
jgi:hypothetical protein